ncbi:MAG TPA: sulfotransferase, partial [Solirubrobacterales bacterium]|nr:sulfotransferase [Solirubrobacterales bacterium]
RRGVEWYRAQFDPEATIRGESSPNYTAYPLFRGVPKRMHSVVPDAKLIYLVRDPLERIGAHWVHNYANGRVDQHLGEMSLAYRRNYVSRSRYHMQLRRFLRRYPLERILILEQDDLRHRRVETLRTVFEFAGVDSGFVHPDFRREQHRTGRKARATPLGRRLGERRARSRRRVLPDEAWALASERWPLGRRIETPDVREALSGEVLAKLREDAERLRELTGRGFERWSIWER